MNPPRFVTWVCTMMGRSAEELIYEQRVDDPARSANEFNDG